MTANSQAPFVSVIIVSWNARDYLEQCLASLAVEAGSYPMEIIVVDNASTDGSPESVERRFPHVRLIRNECNLGFAKANNLGIACSTGRYVCLINSDVKVLKDCIARLIEYCESHLDVGMVGPRVIGGDGRLQRSCRGFPGLWSMFCAALALDRFFPRAKVFCGYALWYWPQESEAEVDILSGCFWLVRREALGRVGLLDESFFMYGEDMDWCVRFWSHGWKLVFVPSAEAVHYGGASSANAPVRFHLEQQRANLQYWRKHHTLVAAGCYFLIAALHQGLRVAGFSLALCLGGTKPSSYRLQIKGSLTCLRWMLSGCRAAEVAIAAKEPRRSAAPGPTAHSSFKKAVDL